MLKEIFFYAAFGAMFWLAVALVVTIIQFVAIKVHAQRLYKKFVLEKIEELTRRGAELDRAAQEIVRMRNFYTAIAPKQHEGNREIH